MLKRTYIKLVEIQEEQAKRHLEEVRSIHQEMRGYKHDFHHHLQTLKGQLEAGEVDRAIAYIEALDKDLQNVDTLLKTGNVTVDAILSAKLAQARSEGIPVTVEANLPPELTLTDVELSIVLGNLLDNAIEACREAAGDRFIRLSLNASGWRKKPCTAFTRRMKRKKQGICMLVPKVPYGCSTARLICWKYPKRAWICCKMRFATVCSER